MNIQKSIQRQIIVYQSLAGRRLYKCSKAWNILDCQDEEVCQICQYSESKSFVET